MIWKRAWYLSSPTWCLIPVFFLLDRLCREQSVYGAAPQPAAIQQLQKMGPHTAEGIQAVQSNLTMVEPGLAQVAYDRSGRQVYYTTTAGGVVPGYQAVAAMAVDGRQGGGPLNQEAGKAAAAAAATAPKAP